LDRHIALLERNELPEKLDLVVLFGPTGSIQEVSISSGWGREFLEVGARFDAVAERLWV